MKRVLLMVCSICLILACLFGLFACVAGMKDVLNIQAYKEDDAAMAREGIAAARDGIKQLMENEDVYLQGVDTYEAGLIAYSDGKSQLSDGYKQYYAGKKKLEEGKKALAEGKKAYEAGKQQIADNTQAYNEGKEKLAKIEPLMPYVDKYVEFRDGNLAALPGFSDAQAWFVKIVRPVASNLGIEIPEDVTDFPKFMQDMVADGKAQLKQYEDGLAQLAEAEKAIAAGEAEVAAGEKALKDAEKQLAKGEKDLAAGGAQLADGDKQLSVYEDGQGQLAAGMEQLLESMVPCTSRSGKQTVPSLKELLGDDFSIWVLDKNGEVKVERNSQFVDLENCSRLCDEAEHYLELQEADIKSELYPRIAMNVMMGLAAIIGIIAGIVGLVGAISGSKKTGFVGGLICAILAVAANVVGLVVGYTDFVYQTRELVDGVHEYTYSGDLQLYALIVLAVIAVIFTIVAGIARKAAKKAEAETVAQANEAAVAGAAAAAAAAAPAAEAEAPAAESEKIADLEAENAALKEMVAKLAADAATVKE